MTVDLRRRFFVFGAAATLVLPPVRTFHILPKLDIWKPIPFQPLSPTIAELITAMMEQYEKELIEMCGIPRFVVVSEIAYDKIIGSSGEDPWPGMKVTKRTAVLPS